MQAAICARPLPQRIVPSLRPPPPPLALATRLTGPNMCLRSRTQRCRRDSPSSSNVSDFYELTPQVKDFKSLLESLVGEWMRCG